MFFFFNDTATTEIYTLSLHDALPISGHGGRQEHPRRHRLRRGRLLSGTPARGSTTLLDASLDRKSTRLNSSHANISYAVFCLKKKTENLVPIQVDVKHLMNSVPFFQI